MSFETVTYEKRDGIGLLTINRPDNLNTINTAMRGELSTIFRGLDEDHDVRVLVVTGAGDKAFCAGADQRERSSGGAIAKETVREAHLHPTRTWRMAMPQAEKPIIAAVNGVCVGGGLFMACAADVTIASENARFRVGHAALGISLQDSLGWLLTKRMGAQRTFEFYATNRIMEAEEAERAGLVMRVVPKERLLDEAMALASTIAQGPPLGMLMTKRAIQESYKRTLEEYTTFERLAYQVTYYSDDSKEARQAFLERRKPNFQGR